MDNTLVMYPNLQYNPIKIPAFTLVEIYKDKVSKENGLGYTIIPIENLSNQEIKDIARAKAELVKPSGYSNYTLLTGDKEEYDHKIIYAVWYADEVPSYPQEPDIESLTPAQPLNIWHTVEVNNEAAPTFVTITLTCSALDNTLEFYINNDYFAIDIKNPKDGVNEIAISKEGVSYNGKPIDSFKMTSAPKLKAGMNYIKVNSIGVSKIDIKYRQKY